jgi:NitT/TauT family transport system substrate-binding protein
MAVKIEKGGWILIFVIGLGLVGFSLYRYGALGFLKNRGSASSSLSTSSSGDKGGAVDPSKPLALPSGPSGPDPQVRVRVNIWVGCAGGLVANGGLETQPGSIFARKGLNVSFKIIDDWTEGVAALATGNVDVMLTTLDVWAKDYPQLKDKGFGAHTFLMVDWSRGADGLIARQGINSIEDLAAKTVAFAPYTPSHFLLWNGLKNSGLNTAQRREIFDKAVHTKDGIEPATLFAQSKVDAAVAWDPDMSDAVAKRAGSRKIYDTKVADRLIADILVVSDSFAAKHPQTVIKLAQGWLEGVDFIKASPQRAYTLIGTIQDFNIPTDLAQIMLGGVRLSDYADNLGFFGSPTAPGDYANVYRMAHEMYREERLVKGTADPEETLDRRYVTALQGQFSTVSTEQPTRYEQPPSGAVPIATQHRSIYFETNSAAMTLDSQAVVDEVAEFMRAYGNTVVDIEGNTDSTGPREYNINLSRQRAETVRGYLIQKYGYPASRMRAIGNGPDRPLDTNATPDGREKNRRTDIKVYPNPKLGS